MELDRAEAIVKELLNPQYLNPTQAMVFSAAWVGQSYGDLAQSAGYDPNYLKCVGAQVWKMLATATGCRVSKRNFRQVLESSAKTLAPCSTSGTSPSLIFSARPSANAVFPTPGSPT